MRSTFRVPCAPAPSRGFTMTGTPMRRTKSWISAGSLEPSDWAQALLVAEAVDSFAREPQAAMLRTILTASTSLLVTEGDRRRLQIELQRTTVDADEAAAVAALDSYRERLA